MEGHSKDLQEDGYRERKLENKKMHGEVISKKQKMRWKDLISRSETT